MDIFKVWSDVYNIGQGQTASMCYHDLNLILAWPKVKDFEVHISEWYNVSELQGFINSFQI